MKINLEINKKIPSFLSAKFLKKVAKNTLEYSDYSFLDSRKITISLALVSEEEIKKINKKYRSQDAVTDVLSFADYESKEGILEEKKDDIFLGELIVCCSYVRDSAKDDKISFKEEMARVVSHGTLHLLGFNHGERMFSIQNKVICDISEKNEKI